jgi:hypothetical protein
MPLILSIAALIMTLGMSAAATVFCAGQTARLYRDAALLPGLTQLLYANNAALHVIPLLYAMLLITDALRGTIKARMMYHAVNLLALSLIVLLASLFINALPFIKLLLRL